MGKPDFLRDQPVANQPSAASAGASGPDWRLVAMTFVLIATLASLAGQIGNWKLAALAAVGAGLGLALYHAAFGFTFGYRSLLRDGYTAQVRGQILLLGLAVLLFYPALAAGSVFGQPVRGFVFPIGLELAIGAFIFGVGMQIGGGCGSGTLYTVGGGSVRMLIVLLFFIVGATGAAYTWELWSGLPRLQAVSLPATFGTLLALALQLGALGLAWFALTRLEHRRHGAVVSVFRKDGQSLLHGNWPYAWGAFALAVLAFATLVLLGRPWGITQAFALWGSQVIEATGLDDPHFWPFWEEPTRVEFLGRKILADATSVMNIALVLGALLAAALAGKFNPQWRIGFGGAVSAAIGGLLLGFGSIMATGCNISALFAGVASGSLHGWVWLAAAIPGNLLGTYLRPFFGLDPRN